MTHNAANKENKTVAGMKKFWHGVKSEFKKISWPDRERVLKQSVAVVGVSVVLGAIIAILDMFLQYGVDFLVR